MDETTYEDQLDPEFRVLLEEVRDEQLWTRRQAQRNEQALARALPHDDEGPDTAVAKLTEEPPGGWNHGRVASPDPGAATRLEAERASTRGDSPDSPAAWTRDVAGNPLLDVRPMDRLLREENPDRVRVRKRASRSLDAGLTAKLEKVGSGRDDCAYVVDPRHDSDRAGMTAHRGVLRGDEHIDPAALDAAVEEKLGVPLVVARDVYGPRGGGPLPGHLRELRAALDALLAAEADAGAASGCWRGSWASVRVRCRGPPARPAR